jgi:hypothetical protein
MYEPLVNLLFTNQFQSLRKTAMCLITFHQILQCYRRGEIPAMELKNMPKNNEKTMPETEDETTNILVGYVRKSNAGGALKISINTAAFSDCSTYVTSDGQAYVPLVMSLNALEKVLNGERAVTTVTQLQD